MRGSKISREEHEEYAQSIESAYAGLVKNLRMPPELFHYTSANNLISVIESGELWATQISCLNDQQELSHGLELLRTQLKIRLSKTKKNATLQDLHTTLLKRVDNHNVKIEHIYVTCFSSVGDDLSQWQSYSTQAGYNIGFDPVFLSRIPEVMLAPVSYKKAQKIAFLRKIITQMESLFEKGLELRPPRYREDWKTNFLKAWLSNLSQIICLFKDSCFASENEWRLILNLGFPNNIPIIPRFSHPGPMFKRHVALQFGKFRLPILSVRVGPTAYPEHCRIGLKHLLRDYKLPREKFLVSEIPLRRSY